MRSRTARLVLHVPAMALAVGVVVSADSEESEPSSSRFEIRATRIEQPMGVVVYRLDDATGEACAFFFARGAAPQPRGCVGRGELRMPGRFALEAVPGVRGTPQTSAYRLDRSSGEICRLRLPATGDARLELVDCVAGAPGATTPSRAATPSGAATP